jgi:hypothetical protein
MDLGLGGLLPELFRSLCRPFQGLRISRSPDQGLTPLAILLRASGARVTSRSPRRLGWPS